MRYDLRKRSLFKIDIGIHRSRSLEDLLLRAQKFIDYEENDPAEEAGQDPTSAKGRDQNDNRSKKVFGGKVEGSRNILN